MKCVYTYGTIAGQDTSAITVYGHSFSWSEHYAQNKVCAAWTKSSHRLAAATLRQYARPSHAFMAGSRRIQCLCHSVRKAPQI